MAVKLGKEVASSQLADLSVCDLTIGTAKYFDTRPAGYLCRRKIFGSGLLESNKIAFKGQTEYLACDK